MKADIMSRLYLAPPSALLFYKTFYIETSKTLNIIFSEPIVPFSNYLPSFFEVPLLCKEIGNKLSLNSLEMGQSHCLGCLDQSKK
jgi:hypothetical protein